MRITNAPRPDAQPHGRSRSRGILPNQFILYTTSPFLPQHLGRDFTPVRRSRPPAPAPQPLLACTRRRQHSRHVRQAHVLSPSILAPLAFFLLHLFLVSLAPTPGLSATRQPTPSYQGITLRCNEPADPRKLRGPNASVSVLRILRGFGAKVGAGNGGSVLSSFPCKLGIMKSACITQGASTIGTSAPFWSLGSVTAVTSARRSSALIKLTAGLLHEMVNFLANKPRSELRQSPTCPDDVSQNRRKELFREQARNRREEYAESFHERQRQDMNADIVIDGPREIGQHVIQLVARHTLIVDGLGLRAPWVKMAGCGGGGGSIGAKDLLAETGEAGEGAVTGAWYTGWGADEASGLASRRGAARAKSRCRGRGERDGRHHRYWHIRSRVFLLVRVLPLRLVGLLFHWNNAQPSTARARHSDSHDMPTMVHAVELAVADAALHLKPNRPCLDA
ncbi:hypothetical protein KCV06_g93, partial [Aureobasidium melanogenum]